MAPERLVGLVELHLSFARMLLDPGLEVVAHRAHRHAAEELPRVDMAHESCVLLHVAGRLDIGHLRIG